MEHLLQSVKNPALFEQHVRSTLDSEGISPVLSLLGTLVKEATLHRKPERAAPGATAALPPAFPSILSYTRNVKDREPVPIPLLQHQLAYLKAAAKVVVIANVTLQDLEKTIPLDTIPYLLLAMDTYVPSRLFLKTFNTVG
ncbi:hypothetical protein HK104_001993 [Borealophlyctis nickersoniae]|nr:hypothetical protein HK104_001993 [Borealophlyctis nickersoniae]